MENSMIDSKISLENTETRESIAILVDTFMSILYVLYKFLHFEVSSVLSRDSISIIVLIMSRSNSRIYIGVTR